MIRPRLAGFEVTGDTKIFRNQVSLKYFFSVLLASGSVFLMLLFAMLVEKYSSYGTEVTIGQKFTINKAGLYVLYVNNKNFKHSDKIELLSESGGGMISGSPYHSLISVDVRGEDYEPASCFCITNPAQYTFLCDGQLGSLYLEMDHGLTCTVQMVATFFLALILMLSSLYVIKDKLKLVQSMIGVLM